jgi:hypothetical protein
MVSALHHRDGVYLHIAHMLDHTQRTGFATAIVMPIQPLRVQEEFASF